MDALKGSEETWVVLMRVDKPNLLMGPFNGYIDAMEGVPEDGWECCSIHRSLEEARTERDKEVTMTLEESLDTELSHRYQD